MLTGAAVAGAVGLWLIVLALTSGLRHQLPLRSPADCPRLRAFLDRDGAAALLRDAAMRVPAFWQFAGARADLLPGALLVTEAGGRISDVEG
ncbi:DUF6286 domain-containing protein, partial [Streptomyces sp. NPDC005727]|uniref:DUF6286 domain-containing protein n=1 Tax=Streptomyces sp. NPDC005727 TaxID=3157053 RepID=UPI0033FACB5E